MVAPALSRPALGLFSRALLISLLFHLSAITLFRIVIYIPQQDTRYFRLAFLEEPAQPAALPTAPSALVAALTGPRTTRPAELPKLSFNPEGRVALGQLSLGKSFYDDIVEPAPNPDSWERFGEGVKRVRASLLSLTGSDQPAEFEGTSPRAKADTISLGPDLVGTLNWSGSAPRELLSAPPAFFRRDVARFDAEYLLNIAPDGAVSSVVSLNTEPSGLESGVRTFLQRCRFAPDLNSNHEATVTLRVNGQFGEIGP